MNTVNSELEVIFAREALRLTTPRKQVFEAMRSAEKPISISQITQKCPQVDRVSIYRTINLFIQLDIVEIVHVGWKKRYELTSLFKAHHHHLYCANCKALIDIHSKKLELLVASIAREYKFSPQEHKFEVSGLCRKCNRQD